MKQAIGNQPVFIRNFYTSPSLVFNADGTLAKPAQSSCWLRGQILVKRVRVRGSELSIEGDRVEGTYNTFEKTIKNQKLDEAVKITVGLDGTHQTDEDIVRLLYRIFLNSRDNLNELVPLAYSDMAYSASNPDPIRVQSQPGVVPPKATYTPDPSYTEEGRQEKRQGIVSLWMVVGGDGKVHQIKIEKCLGAGLDEQAVRAVSTWRFEPARKNGAAIPVQLRVELNFHLAGL